MPYTARLGGELGDESIAFQEVSGLENSPSFLPFKLPFKLPGVGLRSRRVVTLKRGVVVTSTTSWAFINGITQGTIQRRTVVICRLDETGTTPVMVWTLTNALPNKITGVQLLTEGNEIAFDSIEIACETLTVAAR